MSLQRTCLAALLSCATLSATPGFAAGPEAWVPARWQGGPLELARRGRDATLPDSPALREAIRQWYDPATLDLLQGTPINCLLVTWSAGGDPDTERAQQQMVAAYARAARARGMAVLGLVHLPASAASFVQPAIDAGLDGLVIEGEFAEAERVAGEARRALRDKASRAVVIVPAARDLLPAPSQIRALSDALAPGVQELGEEAEATPSSEPWIDSNLWLVQSVRARETSPLWLMQAVPTQATGADYLRAIADAAAAGGCWVVALDDGLRHGLRAKLPEATSTWQQIGDVLTFQQAHAEWFGWRPLTVAGFVQDSAGTNQDLSGANLRLAVRARVPLKVVERPQLSADALEGLRALHAIDVASPTALERKLLAGYAESGGLLLVGPSWQDAGIPEGDGFLVLPAGKGRIVICRDDMDPSELPRAIVDLLGRDNLGLRLFRASSVLSHATVSAAGNEVLVHLLNYASYPAASVLVRVQGDFRTVRLYTPGSAAEALDLDRSGERVEVTVGRLAVYGILRFER